MPWAVPRTLRGKAAMESITSASGESAKIVLNALCADDSVLRERAKKLLEDVDALASASAKTGTKRKADSVIQICVKCQEAFYEDENSDKACRYHSDLLTVDWDSPVWGDHDDGDPTIDTEESRFEQPEGFIWGCCEKPGYRLGCTRGRHDATSKHRGRYGMNPQRPSCRRDDSSDAGTSDLEAESACEGDNQAPKKTEESEEEEDADDDENGEE